MRFKKGMYKLLNIFCSVAICFYSSPSPGEQLKGTLQRWWRVIPNISKQQKKICFLLFGHLPEHLCWLEIILATHPFYRAPYFSSYTYESLIRSLHIRYAINVNNYQLIATRQLELHQVEGQMTFTMRPKCILGTDDHNRQSSSSWLQWAARAAASCIGGPTGRGR